MTTDTLKVHESMTPLFVLSPAQIEAGESFTGQKFFGNSPYVQFALHGGNPSFCANNGLMENTHTLPTGQFSLVTYRLHQRYVEIKANGGPWGGGAQEQGGTDGARIRITVNEVVSRGNSKSACDTNAFQGRIAEVLVYDVVLDDAKVEIVEKYLHDKWWGQKPLPETATSAASAADPEASTDDVPNDKATNTSLAVNPVNPATEAASVAPEVDPRVIEVTQEASPTEKPLIEGTQQTSTTKTHHQHKVVMVATGPHRSHHQRKQKMQLQHITKATQWPKAVKDRVDYIRNFQLGVDVLQALIREHKKDLIALREELFA
ncbi:hypothetical protein V7S43_016676 [Phytophthora oleae]|uniref:Jacalin-type lectin domain-containing protein n=1 Tax=Phytophthora oleae TaxID=2107226 RepID=A0ABD3EVH1_9STRA